MFSNKLRDRLDGYIVRHDGRINKALGGSPFEDADPSSDIYKRVLPSLQPYIEFSDNEKAALGMYGENVHQYYKQLNNQLRTPNASPLDPESAEIVEFMQSNLASALQKLKAVQPRGHTRFTNGQETQVPGQFNRAVTGDFVEQLSRLKPGDEISDAGFASYTDRGGPTLEMFLSNNKDVPNAVIQLAEGSSLRNISPVTEYHEGEHLAMPNTRYKLQSANPAGHYSRKAGDLPLYILEILE